MTGGKEMHYVMSDLHGDYQSYLKMLEQIQFTKEDVLYLLGDVIDRGSEPIALLKDIKDRENIIFLLGNHEDMMLRALKKSCNNLQDLITSTEMKRWNRNGGMATLEQFIRLEQPEQQDLIHFLEESWLVLPQIEVNQQHFYLVHACPGEMAYHEPLKYKDATEDEIHQMVWDRRCLEEWELPESYQNYDPNTVLLFGHTKTNSFMEQYPSKIMYFPKQKAYDVDCFGQLGCICLETLEQYYVS